MTVHDISEVCPRSYDIKAPNSGYCLGKLPSEDAEITHVGPDTPCGEYMRHFWQPVCLSEELGQYPLAIRIMGEDLVAFRDKSGRVGVLRRHCTHRGASLEYGLISKHGIRCCYHGWQFDVDGTILDTPGEPSGSRIHPSFKQGAYPAHEHWGLVFAYMGPPEEKPDFPGFEDYGTPEEGIIPYSTWHPCNWLQCYDNFMDPVHTVFLHSRMTGDQLTPACGKMPVVEWYVTGGGNGIIYVATRRMDDQHVWNRINHVILPNYCEVGTAFEEGDKQKYFQRNTWNRWLVPVDDTHSWTFGWRHFRPGVDDGKGDPKACGRDSIDIGAHQAPRRAHLRGTAARSRRLGRPNRSAAHCYPRPEASRLDRYRGHDVAAPLAPGHPRRDALGDNGWRLRPSGTEGRITGSRLHLQDAASPWCRRQRGHA